MDLELRALERSPEDEARSLKAALRAGRLDARRVQAAAYLGHLPSRDAVGDGAPAGDGWLDRAGWVRVAYHAATAATRLLAGRLTQPRGGAAGCFKPPHEYEARCQVVLEAVRAWLLDPGPTTARAARRCDREASGDLDVTHRPTHDNPSGSPPEYEVFLACSSLVVAIEAPEVEAPEVEARRLAELAQRRRDDEELFVLRGRRPPPLEPHEPWTVPFIARRSVRHSHVGLRDVLHLQDQAARAALRDAVVRGVAPWLLGRADPLRTPR